MNVCILGVGRSGTTAIYSLLQEILIDQIGRDNIYFIYEPFLWDIHVFNGRYDEVIKHFQDMNSISIEGIYNHQRLPMFVKNPAKFKRNNYLDKIFNKTSENTLIKFIRANGRFRLLSEICPRGKFIFIIRNPLDVINSAVIRFSLLGSEFHKDDWNRFAREVNTLYGRGTIDGEKINSQLEKEVLYWYYMNKYALESFEQTNSKPLIICYEDYVSRREFWVDKICNFINLKRKDIYYDYAKKIAGSQTIKNNISKFEIDMLTGYLDKYTALLAAAGITHPIDLDKITSKYKIINTETNRKQIIIGKTPNIMNAHMQKLEGVLIKKDDELGGFKKKIIELDGTLKTREKNIADVRKRISELEGKLGKREDEIFGSRKRLSELEGTLLTKEKDIADARKRISELEEKLGKREDEFFGSMKRLSELEGTLLVREKDIADARKRISELEGKSGKRKDDIIVSRKRLSELEGELTAKNGEIVGLKKKKIELEEELVNREDIIKDITNEISINKKLLIKDDSSLNGLIHKLIKVEASKQNLENQVKGKDQLIRQKDDIIVKKSLENETLEKRLRKIYHSLWWKLGKFLKKVLNFCFGWMSHLKKDSQDGMRTGFPSLQSIKNIKFGISELKFYENSVFRIKGWCFAEKRIDTVKFFIKSKCIGKTPVNIRRSDILNKYKECSDEFCGFMFEKVLKLGKKSKLVLNFFSKGILVGIETRWLELEKILQKGKKVQEHHPADSSRKSKLRSFIRKIDFRSDGIKKLKGFPNERNNNRLYALKDIHKGKRAFLIGNGPSLRIEDLEKLENEITFASNKIFLGFDQTVWRPTYYTVADHVVAQNNKKTIKPLKLEKIFAHSVWNYFKQQKDVIFTNSPTKEGEESWDLIKGVRAGYSVINFDLKLAFWMGIREVYVIGVDFHFEDKSIRTGRFEKGNEVVISVGEQNHFHPDYRKAGETWTIPRLDKQKKEFLKARQMYEAAGGKIYNASRRTKLDAWERVDFDQVVSSGVRSTRNMVSNL